MGGAFVAFWYFATYKGFEVKPVIVATTTVFILATSLLGITYSMMSASWDPDEDGFGLGIDEFNKNVKIVKDGFTRTKENAIIREKMAGLPESEIQQAIQALDRRDKKQEKEKKRLEEMA